MQLHCVSCWVFVSRTPADKGLFSNADSLNQGHIHQHFLLSVKDSVLAMHK